MNCIRALIVDGDAENRRLLRGILEACGVECVEAEDGITALQRASEYGIDVLLLDPDLPRLSGIELIALTQRGVYGRNPPPIIACWNWSREVAFTLAPELNFCAATLNKPATASQVVAALAEAFHTD